MRERNRRPSPLQPAKTGRRMALIALISAGEVVQAAITLGRWKQEAEARDDSAQLAWIYAQLANIQLYYRLDASALQCLQHSLRLYQQSGDAAMVAGLSWSIGSFLARRGYLSAAVQPLRRAVVLAEELGMAQAPRYRARLALVLAELERRG